MRLCEYVNLSINPLTKEGIFSEGNMENIFFTIPINISANSDVIKMCISVQSALHRRLPYILPYLKGFKTCLVGHMRRCHALIH